MRTWTDTSFALSQTDDPMVSAHKDAVSLHLPGYCTDGRGFSLRFLPAHLPRLRELCAALEVLEALTHTDHNPFRHDDACPACVREGLLEQAQQDTPNGQPRTATRTLSHAGEPDSPRKGNNDHTL